VSQLVDLISEKFLCLFLEALDFMKIGLAVLLLLTSGPVNAHIYQPEYKTQRVCFKEIYREQYVAGTRASKGFVKSYLDRVQVPCNQKTKVHHHYHHHRPTYIYSQTRFKQPLRTYKNFRSTKSLRSCNSSITTGGLIGGGLAAALSKQDAYAWAIPLGAVVGMGVGETHC
tara:strand:+ start:190 stop:702 length:513 start_codon:yes stop_codon:yes gene_type:complete